MCQLFMIRCISIISDKTEENNREFSMKNLFYLVVRKPKGDNNAQNECTNIQKKHYYQGWKYMHSKKVGLEVRLLIFQNLKQK